MELKLAITWRSVQESCLLIELYGIETWLGTEISPPFPNLLIELYGIETYLSLIYSLRMHFS